MPGGWFADAGQEAQQCALAGTIRSREQEELPPAQPEVYSVQGHDRAIVFTDLLQPDGFSFHPVRPEGHRHSEPGQRAGLAVPGGGLHHRSLLYRRAEPVPR